MHHPKQSPHLPHRHPILINHPQVSDIIGILSCITRKVVLDGDRGSYLVICEQGNRGLMLQMFSYHRTSELAVPFVLLEYPSPQHLGPCFKLLIEGFVSVLLSECRVAFLDHIKIVQFSSSVVSDSLRPHEQQHTRDPCPSPTFRIHSNSCPSSR